MIANVLNNRDKQIHFVGIGGVGMCGIAEVLLQEGYKISGSDRQQSKVTERLQQLGATIYFDHAAGNLRGVDVLVKSTAIADDNPECVAAKQARIPILRRAEMLAELMRFRYGIAIAGTHGKTTTTSLVSSVLIEADLDPTFVIGGKLNSANSNAHLGSSDLLVAEADESDASFLYLKPVMAVITNIDADHMETYEGDFGRLQQAFNQFIHHLPFYGLAVLCMDDEPIRAMLPNMNRPYRTYGFSEDADVRALAWIQNGLQSEFIVKRKGIDTELKITLNIPGRHNVLNALAAIIIATELGVSDQVIAAALQKFAGVGRRFQSYGELEFAQKRTLLIDDYGHHPREISYTIDAVRKVWPDKRLVLAFQPHRYSRTKDLFDDFVEALSEVDVLLLLDIYPAGEEPLPGVNSQQLVAAINARSKAQVFHVSQSIPLDSVVAEVVQQNDILLTQGAGDIGRMAQAMADKYRV